MDKVLMFVIGAGVGSLITWKIIEQKYKKIADEEIASVVDRYKNRETLQKLFAEPEKNDDKKEYTDKVNDLGYSKEEKTTEPVRREIYIAPGIDDEEIEPYIISPEEYGEVDSYDLKCWTYYADFVLEDEEGEIVGEPEKFIGDALSHFGEYDDNSVFVRNENTECDYEILKHERTFTEVNGGSMDVDAI